MGGIRIGRIAGFPVSVNGCVLVILWLFTRSLASTLPAAVPGYSKGGYWLAGLDTSPLTGAHRADVGNDLNTTTAGFPVKHLPELIRQPSTGT